jgi:predicted phage terminase large subunit-like protein
VEKKKQKMEATQTTNKHNYTRREAMEEMAARVAHRYPNTFIQSVIKDELGNLLKQASIHTKVQKFLTENKRGVIKLPREHGKTTQLISHCSWLIGNNLNIREKIISSSDPLATAKGKAIRETIESKPYREIFPRVQPGREWTNQKFSVVRSMISPDSTVECFGLHSKATGGRADFILFDDPDDEEVVVSNAIREANWRRVTNVWLNLLTPMGKAFIVCTPWHKKDIAHRLENESKWPVLEFPIEGTIPIWPERWDEERLKDKLQDIASLAYGRGFNLKVISDEDRIFKPEWFRYWLRLPERFKEIGIIVDPAIGERETNDYTAIGILGVTESFEVYVLNLIRKRMDFPTALNLIIKTAERAELEHGMKPTIGIEQVAYQKALPQMLKKKCAYKIVGIDAPKSKFIRASRATVHVENGRVLFRGRDSETVHDSQRILYDECIEFPAAAHDDTVDMLAHGVELMLSNIRPRPVVLSGARK